jgi:hypothetical protein
MGVAGLAKGVGSRPIWGWPNHSQFGDGCLASFFFFI